MDPDGGTSRKKWTKDKSEVLMTPRRHDRVTVAKQMSPSPGYEEYLLLLQQRNKMLEKVKLVDKEQLERERKEKGFALYVNGANTGGNNKNMMRKRNPSPSPRVTSKTRLISEISALEKNGAGSRQPDQAINIPQPDNRSRSAPERAEKTQRKNWNASSVNIKTAQGEKMHIHAPDLITGNYTEDFEDVSISESISCIDKSYADSDDETIKGSVSLQRNNNSIDSDSDNDDETISDHVLLTVSDITRLRKSMELNKSLRESLCRDLNDESDIEEDLVTSGSAEKPFSANDVIVLEFAPKTQLINQNGIRTKKNSRTFNEPSKGTKDRSDMTSAVAAPTTSKEIELKPSSNPKNKPPRPLSAVKKSTDKTSVDVNKKSEVLSAIAKENETISEYMKKKKDREKEQKRDNPLINSFMLYNENGKHEVEDRVLQMEPKQQRELYKTLCQLEQTARPSSTAVTHRKSLNRSESKDSEVHKVLLELMTNWGHASLVGLTEVTLFDECNHRINVNTPFLRVDGAKNLRGHENNLFNGKCRTVKERNMFCCERAGQRPVSLSFRVEIPLGSQINKIKIWNYNKNLSDLNIGVRRLRVSIDDDILFDGELDKGCGNQVFDYGQTIVLGSDEAFSDDEVVLPPPTTTQPEGARNTQSKKSSSIIGDYYRKSNSDQNIAEKSTKNAVTKGPTISKVTKPEPKQNPKKQLHHPKHRSVERSPATHNSSEMWIPLTDTPEPSERCQTRILNRSTDNLDLPIVESDSETSVSDNFEQTYNAVTNSMETFWTHIKNYDEASSQKKEAQPIPKSHSTGSMINGHAKQSSESKVTAHFKPNPFQAKYPSANTESSKSARSISSRLPWMESFDTSKSTKGMNTGSSDPLGDAQTSHPASKAEVLTDWLKGSKTDPLSASMDKMFSELENWDSKKKLQESGRDLKTMFDETIKEDRTTPVMNVATEQEEETYRRSASREMARKDKKSESNVSTAAVDKTTSCITSNTESSSAKPQEVSAARRRRWQQQSKMDLEASWTSLDVFEKSHKGRLSMDGDALDEYLRTVATPSGIVVDGRSAPTDSRPPAAPTSVLESISEDVSAMEQFIIPELPKGQNMVINIKSTWGDKYYVGLNGIELFADTGEPISITKVTANPRDINVLPEYKNDPRVVNNLIDGVNKTRDDIHMWLAPFTEGANHFICLTFDQPSSVALMRIWNYNKSRIHSFRGARYLEVSLDGQYIFKGEIARACGGTQGGTESFGDTILFTMSDEILDAVSRHDGQYEGSNFSDEWEDDIPFSARPPTADKGKADRPHTSVAGKIVRNPTLHQSITTPLQSAVPIDIDGTTLVYQCTKLSLNFVETWGDPHYLGLTGMEVVAKDGESIPLSLNQLEAVPRDLHVLKGYEKDDRTLDKVIDGVNITVSDEHMWLIPYTEGSQHLLTIAFKRPVEIVGLRFWNYNKSPEDTYRGAKTVHVYLDGSPVSPPQGFLIRKGPGNCFYDFAQELLFSDVLKQIQRDMELSSQLRSSPSGDDSDDYVMTGNMPKGFVYQFQFLSTHGDLYYLGLNSIEFFNAEGKKIELEDNNIAAYPDSINVLEGVSGDVRTPEKLLLNHEDSTDNMWLAPILPSIINRLFVIFDYPETVSMIKIWNYSKTANRGVKDFSLLVDDLLVYNGTLGPSRFSSGILPGTQGPQSYHTVVFTNDEAIRSRVKHTIVNNTNQELDIQLTNDNQVVSKPASKLQKSADQALRPKTSLQKRPTGKRR